MSGERRRDRRYPFRLELLLSIGRREIVACTENVSFKGILVRTDHAFPERQLVRLRFLLPPEADEFAVTGMVVRQVKAPDGAGVGILLYGLAEAQRGRWNRFVRHVASLPAPAAGPAADAPRAAAPVPLAPQPALAAAVQARPSRPALHGRYWGG